ncbi:MAG: cellulase family glycosylhydrolase [Chitinispirillaceae bacterium]|nr:cellulase family glycosylhydrolase [Chitinispirillaceae bacterium]
MAKCPYRMCRALLYPVISALICIPAGALTLYAQGVAKGPMRNMTAKELVYDMKIGWNLGNTLDAPDGETTWGNPMTTQAMMDAVKRMGFKTVRIPVTWNKHMGSAPNYTVDRSWLDRVEAIANYVLRDSMYAIINSHHDDWIVPTAANQTAVRDRLAKLWSQIATRFRDYSDYLVFETMNEPRQSVNEWNGGTPEARTILNTYHEAAVDAIRATGGNNATRLVMICGHAATPTTECVRDIQIPNNNDPRCIVSLHTYYPQEFCFEGNVSTWGSSTDQANVLRELDRERIDVSTKGGGTAIIGEWGAVDKNNLSSRVAHAEFYAREARSRGMLPVWWDNGARDFGLLNRKSNPISWVWPTIAQALVRGANNAVVPVGFQKPEQPAKDLFGLSEQDGVIHYFLSKPSLVSIRICTVQGRCVSSFNASVQPSGKHSLALPVHGIGSGSYLIELRTENRSAAKRFFISR